MNYSKVAWDLVRHAKFMSMKAIQKQQKMTTKNNKNNSNLVKSETKISKENENNTGDWNIGILFTVCFSCAVGSIFEKKNKLFL